MATDNYASEVNSFSDFKPKKKSASKTNYIATDINSMSSVIEQSPTMYKKVQNAGTASMRMMGNASLASVKMVSNTAIGSMKLMKQTMGDLARGLNEEMRVNKQTTKVQSLSAISPFVGYLVNKFTETEAYRNMVDSIKQKTSDMWESLKEKGRNFFGKKEEARSAYGSDFSQVSGEEETGIIGAVKKKRKKKRKQKEGTVSASEFGDVLLSIEEGVADIKRKVSKKKVQRAVVSDDIPKLAKGGHVEKEGLAYIHKGEDVIPSGKLKKRKRILANYKGVGQGVISTMNDFFVGKEMAESPILNLEEQQVALLGDVSKGVDLLRVEMVGETRKELQAYKEAQPGIDTFLKSDTGKVLTFTAKSLGAVTGTIAAFSLSVAGLSTSMYLVATNLGNIAGFMTYSFLPVAQTVTTALSSVGMLGPALGGLVALGGLLGAVGLFKIGKVLFKKRGGFSSDLPKSSPNVFANIEGILRTQYVGFMGMFENMVEHLRLISKTNSDVASSVTGNKYKAPEEGKTKQYSWGGNLIKKIARVAAGKEEFLTLKQRAGKLKNLMIQKASYKMGLGNEGLDNLGMTDQEVAQKKAGKLVSEGARPAGPGGFGTATLMNVLISIRDALTGTTGSVLGKAKIGVAASAWNTWELLRQVKRENDLCIKSPCTKKKEKKQETAEKKKSKDEKVQLLGTLKDQKKTQKLLGRMGDSLDSLGTWFKKKFPKTSELLNWIWTGITSLFGMVKTLFKPITDLIGGFAGKLGGSMLGGMMGGGLSNMLMSILGVMSSPVVLGALAAVAVGVLAGKLVGDWINQNLKEKSERNTGIANVKDQLNQDQYKMWQTKSYDETGTVPIQERLSAQKNLNVVKTAESSLGETYGYENKITGDSAGAQQARDIVRAINTARQRYIVEHADEYSQFSDNVLDVARKDFDKSHKGGFGSRLATSMLFGKDRPDKYGIQKEQEFLKYLNDRYGGLRGNQNATIEPVKSASEYIGEKYNEFKTSAFEGIYNGFTKPVGDAISSIVGWFTKVGEGVKDTWNKITSGLSDSWDKFKKTAIEPLRDTMSSWVDSLFGWVDSIVNKIKDTWLYKNTIGKFEKKELTPQEQFIEADRLEAEKRKNAAKYAKGGGTGAKVYDPNSDAELEKLRKSMDESKAEDRDRNGLGWTPVDIVKAGQEKREFDNISLAKEAELAKVREAMKPPTESELHPTIPALPIPTTAASTVSTASIKPKEYKAPEADSGDIYYAMSKQGALNSTTAVANNVPPPNQTGGVIHQTISNNKDFVEKIIPYAQDAAQKLKVSPEWITAQAALESGWGKSGLAEKANNLFGMKSGTSRDNIGLISMNTREETSGGKSYNENAGFAAYRDYGQQFNDYASYIARKYPSAVGASSPEDYFGALKAGGYATDGSYVSKNIRMVDSIQQIASSIPGYIEKGKSMVVAGAEPAVGSIKSGFNTASQFVAKNAPVVGEAVMSGVDKMASWYKDAYESASGKKLSPEDAIAKMKESGKNVYNNASQMVSDTYNSPATQAYLAEGKYQAKNAGNMLSENFGSAVESVKSNPGVQAAGAEFKYQAGNMKDSAMTTLDSVIASLPIKTQQTSDAIYLSGQNLAKSLEEVSVSIKNHPATQAMIAEGGYQGARVIDKTNTYGVEMKDKFMDAKAQAEVTSMQQKERLINAQKDVSEKMSESIESSKNTMNNMVMNINTLVKSNTVANRGGGGQQQAGPGGHDALLEQILTGQLI